MIKFQLSPSRWVTVRGLKLADNRESLAFERQSCERNQRASDAIDNIRQIQSNLTPTNATLGKVLIY